MFKAETTTGETTVSCRVIVKQSSVTQQPPDIALSNNHESNNTAHYEHNFASSQQHSPWTLHRATYKVCNAKILNVTFKDCHFSTSVLYKYMHSHHATKLT